MGFKDENEARVIRVSSAIDLDMTRAAEEIARLVKAAVGKTVAEQTMPALAQIREAVRELADLTIPAHFARMRGEMQELVTTLPSKTLDQDQMAAALRSTSLVSQMAAALEAHLPSSTSLGGDVVRNALAKAQADSLLDAGFVLVRKGPALAFSDGRRDADEAHHTPPQSVYSDPPVRQAVQQAIARHGADERLAQATRDGVDDSWHEEP